jgi:MipA family protein
MKIQILSIALIAFASPALAQPEPPAYGARAEDRTSLTLGIGGGIAPEYEGSSDYGFQPGGIIQGKAMVSTFRYAGRISMSI